MMPHPSVSCGVPWCEFATGSECNSHKDKKEELRLHVYMVPMLGRLRERREELIDEKGKALMACKGTTGARFAWKVPRWLTRLLTDSGHCSCTSGVSTRKGVTCPLHLPCTSCMGVCLMM